MILLTAVLLMQAQPPPALNVQWLARPTPAQLAQCSPTLPKGMAATVTLRCETALKDRLSPCAVQGEGLDPGVKQTAQCAARHLRARVVDPTGQAIVGVEIKTDLQVGPR